MSETFYGVPETELICHGANSDPEIRYKGHSFNYYDIEESLFNECKWDIDAWKYESDDPYDMLQKYISENHSVVYEILDTQIGLMDNHD